MEKKFNMSANSQELVSRLSKQVEGLVKPGPSGIDTFSVEINLDNEVFTRYVEALVDSINTCVAMTGGSTSYNVEEMKRYLSTLMQSRVNQVNGKGSFLHWKESIAVPAFFCLVLEHVGRVEDHTLGIELTPSYKCENPMEDAELRDYSRKLMLLQRLGLTVAHQMPRDTKGDWDFMTMQGTANEIKRHNADAHPVKALLGSVLAMRGLEAVLTPRVTYGYTKRFVSMVGSFAQVGS